MNIHGIILRHLKKTLHKREFWFTILLYPAIATGYFYLKSNGVLYNLVNKTGIWYFVISFIIFIYIITIVTLEFVGKKLFHKIQGDKLRIKQDEWGHK
jgi:hypothetical protein